MSSPMDPAITAVIDGFQDAWNRHDAPGISALFVEDADYVNGVGMWFRSRAELLDSMTRYHKTIFRSTHLKTTIADVRLSRPDVAVLHMTWEMDGERSLDDSSVSSRQGLVTMIMTRESDGWKISGFQNTDVAKVPAHVS
jgi:uncharacterized protein (TIGR02246 family)